MIEECFTTPLTQDGCIYYKSEKDADDRAERKWSKLANCNPIAAATASSSEDDFVKYPHWIRRHIEGCTLLDAGCGYGRVAIPLLLENPNRLCLGVDASPVMLTKFRALAEKHGVQRRATLYCGNLTNLPIKNASFDCVFSCGVLLHLPYAETEAVLDELFRVLKPGGRIILASSFPNLLNLEGLQNAAYQRLYSARNGPVRPYTRSAVRGLFRRYSHVQVFSASALLLPRQIGPIPLPFGTAIRWINTCGSSWIRNSGWFASHHEVVAVK